MCTHTHTLTTWKGNISYGLYIVAAFYTLSVLEISVLEERHEELGRHGICLACSFQSCFINRGNVAGIISVCNGLDLISL